MEKWLDKFFRARRIGVIAIPRANRTPLMTPIWFDYDGKVFRMQVDPTSAKAKAFAKGEPIPVALTVQSEVPPYRYAIVHGTAVLRPNTDTGLRRRLARKYFGKIGGDMYVTEQEKGGVADGDLRLIEFTPERFVSHDFGPEAGAMGRLYFKIYRWFRPVPA